MLTWRKVIANINELTKTYVGKRKTSNQHKTIDHMVSNSMIYYKSTATITSSRIVAEQKL